MVSIRSFSMILATLFSRELASSNGPPDFSLSVCLPIVAFCIGVLVLGKCFALWVALEFDGKSRPVSPDPSSKFSGYRRMIEVVWILLLPIGLIITGWGPWLKSAELAGLWPSVALAFWFAPTLFLVLGLDLVTSQLEQYVEEQIVRSQGLISQWTMAAEQREKPGSQGLLSKLSVRLRLGDTGGVVVCIFPVLAIVSFTDILGMLAPDLPVHYRAVLSLAAMLVVAVCTLPWWLSVWMRAETIPPGALKQRIERICSAAGIAVLKSKWINSQNRWSGAAVVGWLPANRQLWLGDGLFERLSSLELEMVLLHELAHIKRRHFLWRIMPVFAAVAIGGSVAGVLGSSVGATLASSIAFAVGIASALFGLAWGSHWCELDADLEACELASKACPWANNRPELAAVVLVSALRNLLSDSSEAAQTSWLHPSLNIRRSRLLDYARDRRRRGSHDQPGFSLSVPRETTETYAIETNGQ